MLVNMFWITLEVSRESTRAEKRKKIWVEKIFGKKFPGKSSKTFGKSFGKKVGKSWKKLWGKFWECLEKVV